MNLREARCRWVELPQIKIQRCGLPPVVAVFLAQLNNCELIWTGCSRIQISQQFNWTEFRGRNCKECGLLSWVGLLVDSEFGDNMLYQKAGSLRTACSQIDRTLQSKFWLFILGNNYLKDELKCANESSIFFFSSCPCFPQVGINMAEFPDFASELNFVEQMVTEESVFCLPSKVGQARRRCTPIATAASHSYPLICYWL